MRDNCDFKAVCWMVVLLGLIGLDAGAAVTLGTPFETDPAQPYLYDIYASEIVGASGDDGGLMVLEEGGTVWGMPFDDNGEAVASQLIELSPTAPANEYYYPSVAFGDGMYLVGWSLNGVAVQRVSSAGERIGEPIRVDDDGYYPTIQWDGSAFLVSWQGFSDNGREIAWAKVSTDGEVLINELVTEVTDATEPAMALANGVSLMAWYANPETQSTGIYGVMVDNDGVVIDGVFQISGSESGYDVRMSSDGNRVLVVWRDDNAILGRFVAAPDAMSDIFQIVQGGRPTEAVVAFDGTNFGLVYKDYQPENQVYFLRLSPEGEVVGEVTATEFVYPNANALPALIPLDGGYYVGYQDEFGVLGMPVDETLSPLSDAVGLSLLPHPQYSANLIFNGDDYIISFTDEREGERIYSSHAVRVSQEGQVREAEAMHISDAAHRGSYAPIATLGDGESVVAWYLWEDRAGQMTRVIHADGTLGEMNAISDAATSSISIAAYDDQYLLVSVDDSLSPESYVAVGQFLDADGLPVGDAFDLLAQSSYLTAAVSAAADGYLMFFRDGATYGMPIAPNGESEEVFILAPASARVQTVVNDTQTLVIWSEAAEARYGQFYENGALVGEKFLITSDGSFGDATWDGSRFVAVWEDSNDATFMRYIDTNGDMGPVESLFDAEECFGPKITSNQAGQLLLGCVAYQYNFKTSRLVNYLIGAPLTDPIIQDTGTGDVTQNDTEESGTGSDSEMVSHDTDTGTSEVDDTSVNGPDGDNPDADGGDTAYDLEDASGIGDDTADGTQADASTSKGDETNRETATNRTTGNTADENDDDMGTDDENSDKKSSGGGCSMTIQSPRHNSLMGFFLRLLSL